MAAQQGWRPLRAPLIALALALAALYGAWLAGRAPLSPHAVLAELLDLSQPAPLEWLVSFAGLWQFAPLLLLLAPWWTRRQRWGVVATGVTLAAAFLIASGTPQWWLYTYMYLAGAGLTTMAFFAHQWRLAPDPTRRAGAGYLLGAALIFAGFGVATKTYLLYSSTASAPVLDLSALQLDAAAFGFSPSAWAVELARASPALRRALAIVYELLPLAMMAAFGLEARDPRRVPFGMLKGVFACGFAAAATYAITPVAGPFYVFGPAFPQQLGALLQAPTGWVGTQPGFAPRNAFPSYHLAWALLAVILTLRFQGAVRAAFGAYALLIALATLALGEHYLIDLVAAFPALLAVAALCTERLAWREPERWQALTAGLTLYLAWAVLLQPGVASAARAWPLALTAWCAVNVAVSVLLYRRLAARVR